MLFLLLPNLLNINHLPLPTCNRCVQHAKSHGQVRRAHKLNAIRSEIHLIEVKIVKTLGLDLM